MTSPAEPPNSDLQQLKLLFAEARLPLPPIPSALAARLHRLGNWHFGTRADAPNPYNLAWFVQEVQERPVPDYVVLGHGGHGVNSWALHYYLVYGPLALFLQNGWGGAYMDNDTTVQQMAERFTAAVSLIEATEAAQQRGRLALPERLVVVVSDFSGSRWKYLGSALAESGAETSVWHGGTEILQDVLATVEGR